MAGKYYFNNNMQYNLRDSFQINNKICSVEKTSLTINIFLKILFTPFNKTHNCRQRRDLAFRKKKWNS